MSLIPTGLRTISYNVVQLGIPCRLLHRAAQIGLPLFKRSHCNCDQFVHAGFASRGHALNGLNRQGVAGSGLNPLTDRFSAEQLQSLAAAHKRHRAYAARFCKRGRGHLTSEAVWLSLGLRAS